MGHLIQKDRVTENHKMIDIGGWVNQSQSWGDLRDYYSAETESKNKSHRTFFLLQRFL